MENKQIKKWTIGLLCLSMAVPLLYSSNVFAEDDDTLKEMITDSFVIIEDDGTTRIVDLETVAANEEDEISVADMYEVVTNIGGDIADVETVETFDSKEEAQVALNELEKRRSNQEYDIQPFDLSRAITTGVAYLKTSDVSEYVNAKTGETGYTSGAYGVDGAYIGEFDGKVRVKFAGVTADFDREDVKVENYSSNSDVSYYMLEDDGILRHYYVYGSTHAYASTRVGYDVDFLAKNTKYYSYDGHYFYKDYATMIKDYQKDTYSNAVNKNEPYYNYYQYLSHRSKTNWTATDFDNLSKNMMGTTSYNTSKFKDTGQYFVSNQNDYTVNALLMYGVAANESNFGRSSIAKDKNNLFGHGAVDSNPYYGANGYNNVGDSIKYHARQFVSEGYLDYNDWRHYGPHLGDKEGGLNVKYASDPYWGEKAACRAYYLDSQSKDYGLEKIGIITGTLDNYPLYKEASTTSTVVKKLNGQSNMPVIIVDTVSAGGKTWYKILADTALSANRNEPDWERTYDASHDYLYILADKVQVVYEGIGDEEVKPDPKPEPIKLGDVNGDGKISSLDYVKVKNHIMKKSTLKGDALKAADMNGDGKISSVDYVKIKNIILNSR